MKVLLIAATLICSVSCFEGVSLSYGGVVWCTNCSDMFTQSLERVTNIEKLQQAYKQVSEAMKQTEQQVEMVQQGIKRYQNMLQNTATLPGQMRGMMQGTFTDLSSLTRTLNVNRGDAQALSQIFQEVYKKRDTISSFFKSSSEMTEEERAQSEAAFNKMRKEIEDQNEKTQEAAFQESGAQIEEIEQKAAQLDGKLNDLLTTPDGQMKALEAGNQIATLQLRESQRLRQLLAVSIQSSVQKSMQDEKSKQMDEEAWKATLTTDKIKNFAPNNDPF